MTAATVTFIVGFFGCVLLVLLLIHKVEERRQSRQWRGE